MTAPITPMSFRNFAKLLPKICGRDTSYDPDGWIKENLLWGHCVVVSLLAQSLFQGEILYGSLKGTKFAQLTFHFWNSLPGGKQKDFTRAQFGKDYPKFSEIKTTNHLFFTDKDTQSRFKLLQERFEAECRKSE